MDANPMPIPATILPTKRTSLLKATPITTDPMAKTTLANKITGFRPSI